MSSHFTHAVRSDVGVARESGHGRGEECRQRPTLSRLRENGVGEFGDPRFPPGAAHRGACALQTRGRPPGVCSRTGNGEVVGLEATLEFEGEQQVRELALPICTPFAVSVFAGEVVDVDPADHSMSA